ncbi:hypothetical protein JCM8097_003010 [Rhodosporidiobolus ruineniae]
MPDATPSWKRDLEENGYAVVRGAVPAERAEAYTQRAFDWAKRSHGFDVEDRSTWRTEYLPVNENGLINLYGSSHEKWVWEARMEERVIEVFEELWGTKELLVSFDAINLSVPVGPHARTDIEPAKPWPHIDQQPEPEGRPGLQFELAQGLLAMTPSGPDDGGLVVLKRSHALVKQFFDETGGVKEKQDWGHRNYYEFTAADLKWFRQQPGVEEIKVETQPGDLILWDSRTIHWNRTPTAEQVRSVVYVCYAPRSMASSEVLETRRRCFEQRLATTHWPAPFIVVPLEEYGPPKLADGTVDPRDRARPLEEPVVTERMEQLVGIRPY